MTNLMMQGSTFAKKNQNYSFRLARSTYPWYLPVPYYLATPLHTTHNRLDHTEVGRCGIYKFAGV